MREQKDDPRELYNSEQKGHQQVQRVETLCLQFSFQCGEILLTRKMKAIIHAKTPLGYLGKTG